MQALPQTHIFFVFFVLFCICDVVFIAIGWTARCEWGGVGVIVKESAVSSHKCGGEEIGHDKQRQGRAVWLVGADWCRQADASIIWRSAWCNLEPYSENPPGIGDRERGKIEDKILNIRWRKYDPCILASVKHFATSLPWKGKNFSKYTQHI